MLLVPLWFARMLRDNTSGLSLSLNRNAIIVAVSIMLLLNSYILSGSGPRGTDVIGQHIGDEIEDGEDVLFLQIQHYQCTDCIRSNFQWIQIAMETIPWILEN